MYVRVMEYLGQITKVKDGARSGDLIRAILKATKQATDQTKRISLKFAVLRNGKISRTLTARKIWEYLRTKIRYVKDGPNKQNLFLPSAFTTLRRGDCKSYSLFASSILTNLGIPNGYVFTSYRLTDKPTHVYNFFENSKGKKIPLDGCFNEFGIQKKPLYIRKIQVKY